VEWTVNRTTTQAAQPPGGGWLQRLAWFVLGVLAVLGIYAAQSLVLPRPSPEHGELVILSGLDKSFGRQRQRLVDEWNRTHHDNPARIEELSSVADAQHSEMVARAQSGASHVDVYNLDVTWIAEFAAANYIRPLDDSVDTSGFLDRPLKTCRFADKLWALPFNTDAGLLYYRKDVIGEKAALPSELPPSANDMLAMVEAKHDLKAGYVGQLGKYEGLTVNALEAIWAAGGDVLDGDRVVIDRPEALNGLRRLAGATVGTGGRPPALLPESLTYTEDDSRLAFQRGDVALMRNWPVAYGLLADSRDPRVGSFGVAPLPGTSVLGGQDLAIASDTTKPSAARALVEFLTSEDSELKLFRDGGLAATRSAVYQDQGVRDRQPYAQDLLQAVSKARARPITTHYALFSSVFQDIVVYALANGGNLPEGAVTRLGDAVRGRLRPKGS
jgi:multiple sugar transport system substrate-binding protein